jgi:transcriptional regulator with XRE-family HTH domain
VSRGSQQSPRSAEYGILLELLREARLASGMTQKSICDKLGRPKNYVLKVERGERRLDVVELFALCEAIGAEPLALLSVFARLSAHRPNLR